LYQDGVTYTMGGDTEDFQYFYLNSETGDISLRNSLLQTAQNTFQVR